MKYSQWTDCTRKYRIGTGCYYRLNEASSSVRLPSRLLEQQPSGRHKSMGTEIQQNDKVTPTSYNQSEIAAEWETKTGDLLQAPIATRHQKTGNCRQINSA
jgi:hypothetical protein